MSADYLECDAVDAVEAVTPLTRLTPLTPSMPLTTSRASRLHVVAPKLTSSRDGPRATAINGNSIDNHSSVYMSSYACEPGAATRARKNEERHENSKQLNSGDSNHNLIAKSIHQE